MVKNVLGGIDLDKPLYRVFTAARAISLFQTGTNGLVRPAMWDDPFENFFLQCMARDPATGVEVSLRNLSDDWYGQCWSLTRESDAMWRIYGPSKDGVRVSTTARKLFESIWDEVDEFRTLKYFIGKVKYLRQSEFKRFIANTTFSAISLGGQAAPFAETLLMKREAFKHENEVRLLFQDVDEPKRGVKNVASFPFDANSILDGVLLDPRMDSANAALLEKRLRVAGCTRPIKQSMLYRPPTAVITL